MEQSIEQRRGHQATAAAAARCGRARRPSRSLAISSASVANRPVSMLGGAAQPPQHGGQAQHELAFGCGARAVFGQKARLKGPVVGGAFKRRNHRLGGEPMAKRIASRALLAECGAGTGAFAGVEAVGRDLLGRSHRGVIGRGPGGFIRQSGRRAGRAAPRPPFGCAVVCPTSVPPAQHRSSPLRIGFCAKAPRPRQAVQDPAPATRQPPGWRGAPRGDGCGRAERRTRR